MTYKEILPLVKIGMRVKITKDSSGFHGVEGIVTELKHEEIRIEVDLSTWSSLSNEYHIGIYDEAEILTNPDGTPWVHPDEPKFQVGDRVKEDTTDCWGYYDGIDEDEDDYHWIKWQCSCHPGMRATLATDEIVKIEDEPKSFTEQKIVNQGFLGNLSGFKTWDYPSSEGFFTSMVSGSIIKTNEAQPQKETKTMSVIKALKAKLSSTDRTLVKHGYLTNTGERTSSYESELWDAVKSRLIEAEDTSDFRAELAKALQDEE